MTAAQTITLASPAFSDGEEVPTRFTCEGEGRSPALHWSNVPGGTRSLALVVDDPDAPDPKAPLRTFVHWVVYDIPPSATELPEAADEDTVPVGTRFGNNDGHRRGWYPPCPPIGRHRYVFKLYALDAPLGTLANPTKQELEKAMEGHILGQGVLVGTYQKKPKAA